jgi:acetyl esterase/lipase
MKTGTMTVTHKIGLLILLALTISPGACRTEANTQPTIPSPTAPAYMSKLGTVEKDIAYNNTDYINLKLDIYYPLMASGVVPAVIYLHGGAWIQGDKNDAAVSAEVSELTKRGFLVASINYGLAPVYKIQEQIENVKSAVRFLRSNALRFGIDPDKIGALGASAGGHLASLLGTTDTSAGMDGSGGYLDKSSRVQAVVDMYGPIDLKTLFSGYSGFLLEQLVGASNANLAFLDKISPLTYISDDDPPFLILHGDKDSLVPLSQSQIFYQRLLATGVPVTLVVVKNGEHGFTPAGGTLSPTRIEITQAVADFFESYLK